MASGRGILFACFGARAVVEQRTGFGVDWPTSTTSDEVSDHRHF